MEELLKHADSVIILDNESILEISYGFSVDQEYARLNEIILDVLKNLVLSITKSSLINLNPENFEAIFKKKRTRNNSHRGVPGR